LLLFFTPFFLSFNSVLLLSLPSISLSFPIPSTSLCCCHSSPLFFLLFWIKIVPCYVIQLFQRSLRGPLPQSGSKQTYSYWLL
jgi:hypothetical protein